MKPIPAPLPKKEGIFWLKIATQTYQDKCEGNGWNWNLPPNYGWIIAAVNPNEKEFPIIEIMGSDEIARWDEDNGVVVEVGAEIITPQTPEIKQDDKPVKKGFRNLVLKKYPKAYAIKMCGKWYVFNEEGENPLLLGRGETRFEAWKMSFEKPIQTARGEWSHSKIVLKRREQLLKACGLK